MSDEITEAGGRGIEFDVLITQEAVRKAHIAFNQRSEGWHLVPHKFSIVSSINEDYPISEFLDMEVYKADKLAGREWRYEDFSAIYPNQSNDGVHRDQLINDITIPADANITSEIEIKRIYFIYRNYRTDSTPAEADNSEFLFAVAEPKAEYQPVKYVPGTSLSLKFLFALQNSEQPLWDIIKVENTLPLEIENHNNDVNSHLNLLARDGSRTATGILYYETEPNFEIDEVTGETIPDTAIITKGYLNDQLDELRRSISQLDIAVKVYIDGV